jgi:hypothetical protein
VTLSDATFSGCSCSSGDGGVIHCLNGTNLFHSSTFLYCSVGGFGGTIYLREVGVTCTNCSWLNCFSGDGNNAIAH